jgi:hypothetical protein
MSSMMHKPGTQEMIPGVSPLERRDSSSFGSGVIAFFIVVITAGIFCAITNDERHWFLIPVAICGLLMGTDAIEWLRGRLDLYDPVGLIGILGFHFFFLAPLLHVQWDFWMHEVAPPADWRDWLGYMGLLNVIGLICYRFARRFIESRPAVHEKIWDFDQSKLRIFLPLCILVSIVLQTWVYMRMGGISGYMDARINDPSQFIGFGWIFMISESAPILVAFLVIATLRTRKVSWFLAGLSLAGLFGLQMLFGGLRGSRSETVLLLFWVVGCFHFLVRPVPRKLVYVGCIFLFAFMYFYGFYKDMGAKATEVFSNADEREQMAEQTGRTAEAIALGDFGRADVQAFILFRLMNDGPDFTYAKGRTYLGALALLVPSAILPNKPETKLKEGTEIETGTGGYVPGVLWSSRVYGLAGEAMLNFGPISVPFAYALFGLFVGWFRSRASSLLPGDTRFLLVPFGVYMCISIISGDSDNLIFGLAKDGLMPFLVVLICSQRSALFVHKFVPTHSYPMRTETSAHGY